MRRLSAETAGAVALPRGASPNASTSRAIVLAVPITPHVPTVGTSASLASDISSSVSLSALKSPQRRRQSVQAPTRSPRKLPVLIGPVTSWTKGILALSAPITWAGTVLSHPPTRTTASTGRDFSISSVSIAIRLRRYIEVGCAKLSCKLIVGNAIGNPPAAKTPARTCEISS